jgi:hypothetical protein
LRVLTVSARYSRDSISLASDNQIFNSIDTLTYM